MNEQAHIERIPCRSEGCTNTILPATAKANDGYCMPCVQKRRRAEREAFVRQHRRLVNPYEGITDPVEIIRILQTPRRPDPLVEFCPPPKSIEEIYASLDQGHAGSLMSVALKELEIGNTDFADDVAQSLAVLTTFPLDSMLEGGLARNHVWPPVTFRGAGSRIRDLLFARLKAISGTLSLDHTLSALAWIGDNCVSDAFWNWKQSPPAWRKELHVDADQYAHVAGWEPTAMGRRELHYETCFSVRPVNAGEMSFRSVTILKETTELCRWCKSPLVLLFDLDLTAPELAYLQFDAPRLPVLTCEACTCFGTLFAKVSSLGSASWSEHSHQPNWLPENIGTWGRGPWSRINITLTGRRPIHAVEWCMELPASQLGGLPTWVQDSEYPSCPECTRTMKFIAQLDNGYFAGHEGIYYAFLCSDCRITATTYQQS